MRAVIGEQAIDVDYAAIVDPVSLEPLSDSTQGLPAIALVAGRVGSTRLIDNMLLS
jgi:pantothenate synthetase